MARKDDDYDDISKLCACIKTARQGLEYPRSQREKIVRALAGPEWSEETSQDPQEPVNLLDLFVRTLTPNVIAQNPRVLLSTFHSDSKPAVAAMQRWLNLEIARMEFAETMQRVAVDAFLFLGITKVGLATPADVAGTAWKLRAGQPFIESVSLDDFVFDLHARRFSEASFMANRIRRPLDAVKDSKLYGKGRKDLTPSIDPPHNAQGDQRTSVLGRGWYGTNEEDYEPMVDLWEIYLPRKRMVVTVAADDSGDPSCGSRDEPLRQVKWLGPECGPFHLLGYGLIPDNAMPKGPMQTLYLLHQVINGLYRKLIEQARRQKNLTLSSDGTGVQRIVDAGDGDAIKNDNPEATGEKSFGGPNAMNFQFADHLAQKFSYMAGNMDAFAGLSPQSKTASQDKMLNENASRLITDMQARTVSYVSKVLKSYAWYQWEHPVNKQSYEHPVQGMKKGIGRTLYPRDAMNPNGEPQMLRRQIPFDALDLHVDPYSTLPQTPATKLATLERVVAMWAPFAPLSAQQGIMPDWNFFFRKVGEYLDQPDLQEFLTVQDPVGEGAGPSHERTMPSETERTYTRENVAMRTDKGDSQNLRNALMGVDTGNGKPQLAELGGE